MIALNKLTIRFKILMIPVVGTIGFLIYLLMSVTAMSQIVNQLERAYVVEYKYLETAKFALTHLDKIKETLGNAVTMGEQELLDTADGYAKDLKENLQQAAAIDLKDASLINKMVKDFESYYQQGYKLSSEMVDGTIDFDTLATRSTEMADKLNALQSDLQRFKHNKNQAFNEAFESVNSKVSSTTTVGITIGVITIIVLFGVALPITTSISNSLKNVISSLKNIAQDNGDLTVRLQTTSQDEIGDLVFWFNNFIEKLQGVIKSVVNTAMPLANTANNIQRLSNETITSFNRQNDSISASKSSVEEMSHSVDTITSNAADAVTSAQNANHEASNGKNVVDKTVIEIKQLADVIKQSSHIINQLNEDTEKVNVVLDVIKGIAEQTNLLALNAAIEAARAGEQGRGFAVVADEVRGLASRTQESTEQINQMIEQLQSAARNAVNTMETSILGVESSVNSANRAGNSLQEITEAINTISQMNDEIANSTRQQTSISTMMVDHVDEIQQCALDASNATTEIASVSDELTGLATKLEKIALQFKV